MDEGDQLPVATAVPRRLFGRLTALRGAVARWIRARFRHFHGREAVLLLTGIFFSAMMICMGYVADRANKAADAIDEAQRAQQLLGHVVEAARSDADEPADEAVEAAPSTGRDHVFFYWANSER